MEIMGLYDRDYAQVDQHGGQGGFRAQTMVTRIIIVTAVAYLIDNFAPMFGAPDHFLNRLFGLRADLFTHPWNIYQTVTVGLTHAGMEETIFHILGNMYMLWLFGRALESKYGSREFLALYLFLLIGSSLVWVTGEWLQNDLHARAVGASGAITGLIVLYVISFPHQKFLVFPIPFPVPAWSLGILIVGMDALGTLGIHSSQLVNPDGPPMRIAYTAHIGGAIFGFLYYQFGIHLTGRSSSSGWKMPSLSKTRLQIHNPDRRTAELDRQADTILEKVHRQGAESLTAKERKLLDEYSRRMRQKQR